MCALGKERFRGVQWHGFTGFSLCYRNAVLPVDMVRVKNQLVFLFDIVEHCHLAAADYGQLLFLKGMEPTDEDMGLGSALEVACAKSRVWPLRAEVTSTTGGDPRWHFAEQEQDCGDVMWREAPQNVFFRTQFSKVQARGEDVLDPSQFTFFDHAFESENCGMIFKDMSNHQHSLALLGNLNQLLTLARSQSKRLFNKDVLAAQQTELCDLVMLYGGNCDRNGVCLGIPQDIVKRCCRIDVVLARHLLDRLLVDIAHPTQCSETVKASYKVPAPIAGADHRDSRNDRRCYVVHGGLYSVQEL